MRWFKHFTDNHRGRAVQEGFQKFGWQAYLIYLIIELCAEKLEQLPDRVLTEEDCVFRFNAAYFRSVARTKRLSTGSVLAHYQLHGWLAFTETDLELEIKMPMLLDLLESDQKKSRLRRVQVARTSRLEKNKSRVDIDSTTSDSDKVVVLSGSCEPLLQPSLLPIDIMNLWNEGRGSFPACRDLTDARKKKCRAQLKKYPDIRHWKGALNALQGSSFARDRWGPGFDEYLREDVRIKALEGKYDDRRQNTNQSNVVSD